LAQTSEGSPLVYHDDVHRSEDAPRERCCHGAPVCALASEGSRMIRGLGVNGFRCMRRVGGALIAIGAYVAAAAADETVNIGASSAVLLGPKSPRASIILVPGGNGAIHPGPDGTIHGLTRNQLVRTRHAYASRGNAVLVVDAGVNLAEAVDYMARIKRPVTVVATSRGTIRAAE